MTRRDLSPWYYCNSRELENRCQAFVLLRKGSRAFFWKIKRSDPLTIFLSYYRSFLVISCLFWGHHPTRDLVGYKDLCPRYFKQGSNIDLLGVILDLKHDQLTIYELPSSGCIVLMMDLVVTGSAHALTVVWVKGNTRVFIVVLGQLDLVVYDLGTLVDPRLQTDLTPRMILDV